MDYVYYGSIKIPIIYYLFAAIFGLVIGFYCYYKINSKIKGAFTAILAGYLFLILSTTVISRTVHADYRCKLFPFWSYIEILKGRTDLLIENIANVIMLVPIGVLLPIAARLNGKKTVLIGFLFSTSIEVLQLILKRGLFEFDDIIHNSTGCLLGYVIYKLVNRMLIIRKELSNKGK